MKNDCHMSEQRYNNIQNYLVKIMAKQKFTDKDLMAFADKETKGEKAMDILSVLLQGDDEARELSARLDVFVDTRNALVNNIIKENK